MPGGPAALALWAVACAGLALAATAAARRYAIRRRLIDQPGARRSHAVASPRGGGIAIVLVMLVALLLVALLVPQRRMLAGAALAGLVLVAGIGWLDDHRPLSARLRLAVHALASALLGGAVLLSGGDGWLALGGFVLAIGLVNAWNFMDGINGLAASQAAAAAAGYALVAADPATRWLCVALAAGCVGFLPFNVPRARIFLGDVGSGALGYVLAVLVVLLAGADDPGPLRGAPQTAAALALLLPLSAFMVDAGLTLARRILRREPWWTAHVQHAYQRWAAAAGSHGRVAWPYLGWTCVAILVMVGTWGLDGPVIITAASAWYLGGGIAWAWLQSHHRQVNEERSA